MDSATKKTHYFKEPGKQNTGALLGIVKDYIEKEKTKNVVVASSTGETGAKAAKTFKNVNTVVVTHHHGFLQQGKHELREEFKREILLMARKSSQEPMP